MIISYLKQKAETLATIDEEGWLHSGDQAKIDEDGFITITGRLKELIVTAGGENVSPVPIENKIIELCPLVQNGAGRCRNAQRSLWNGYTTERKNHQLRTSL